MMAILRVISSTVEQLTLNQLVPSSNLGLPMHKDKESLSILIGILFCLEKALAKSQIYLAEVIWIQTVIGGDLYRVANAAAVATIFAREEGFQVDTGSSALGGGAGGSPSAAAVAQHTIQQIVVAAARKSIDTLGLLTAIGHGQVAKNLVASGSCVLSGGYGKDNSTRLISFGGHTNHVLAVFDAGAQLLKSVGTVEFQSAGNFTAAFLGIPTAAHIAGNRPRIGFVGTRLGFIDNGELSANLLTDKSRASCYSGGRRGWATRLGDSGRLGGCCGAGAIGRIVPFDSGFAPSGIGADGEGGQRK
jgi:hypothetical protein